MKSIIRKVLPILVLFLMFSSIVYTLKFSDDTQQEQNIEEEQVIVLNNLKKTLKELDENPNPYLVVMLKYYYEEMNDLGMPIDSELKEKTVKYCKDEKYNLALGTEWCR